ncbi:hypothetical protein J6590_025621 [Homalodisca vitripennis]|nr:hypothetical protein J6590_025621 [Homalodisca vitripennis]
MVRLLAVQLTIDTFPPARSSQLFFALTGNDVLGMSPLYIRSPLPTPPAQPIHPLPKDTTVLPLGALATAQSLGSDNIDYITPPPSHPIHINFLDLYLSAIAIAEETWPLCLWSRIPIYFSAGCGAALLIHRSSSRRNATYIYYTLHSATR